LCLLLGIPGSICSCVLAFFCSQSCLSCRALGDGLLDGFLPCGPLGLGMWAQLWPGWPTGHLGLARRIEQRQKTGNMPRNLLLYLNQSSGYARAARVTDGCKKRLPFSSCVHGELFATCEGSSRRAHSCRSRCYPVFSKRCRFAFRGSQRVTGVAAPQWRARHVWVEWACVAHFCWVRSTPAGAGRGEAGRSVQVQGAEGIRGGS
jgi:hypothetical protein